MTNNKPGNDLISLQVAPVNHYHPSRENKVPSPVTMNNLGARLILEGRHGDALRYLSISMKQARALLARDTRHHHRRGSNGDLSCQPVNHPSFVVEGQEDSIVTSVSMDQRQRPSSSNSRRHSSFSPRHHHRGAPAGTMDASTTSGQEREAGGSSALETMGGLSSTDVCSTTSKEEEDQEHMDFANNVPMTRTPDVGACSQKRTTPKMMTSLASSDTFVYADPIVLDDEHFVCHRHRQCLMKITVTILFNMALAHHLMARSKLTAIMNEEESSLNNDEERRQELQRNCRSDLKRAVTLYTLSCRIHVFERLSMNEMIAMAHLNNLGQIHAILGNATLSSAFFEKLVSNLALYTESYRGGKHPATRGGRRRRLAGFYRNAAQIILRGPELAPAA